MQVMANVYDDPEERKWSVHVTDFTTNEMFWQTGLDGYPGGERIDFTIFCFDKVKSRKLVNLKKGDRVYLRNIRVKLDNMEGTLEGHIGERGDFDVRRLKPDDPACRELDEA